MVMQGDVGQMRIGKPRDFRAIGWGGALLVALNLVSAGAFAAGSGSALSTEPIPMKKAHELPARTPPLLEIGPRFLDTGNIDAGFELPTGAVWQPALWVFGGYRTALQYFDNGPGQDTQEWANRLDLFANLQCTATERILLGVSPLRRDGSFTGYTRKGSRPDSFNSEFNANITTLFFEGELGEIFPNLDPDDRRGLDIGISVGRQPLFFQEGIMINDTVDAIGLTRDNNVIPGYSLDSRVTALFGWNDVHRNDNKEDKDAVIAGLFTETDFRSNTFNFDFAYAFSNTGTGADLGAIGIGSIQRIGHFNTALWVNHSWTPGPCSTVANSGTLLFGQVTRTLPHSHDLVYVNGSWGIDQYSSIARDPTAGGPLGQMGILYAAVGLGSYGAALSNSANDAVGLSVGYQRFFDNDKTQLVLEIGGRQPTESSQVSAIALGARLQFAVGNRFFVQFDGFVSSQEGGTRGAGLRTESGVQF